MGDDHDRQRLANQTHERKRRATFSEGPRPLNATIRRVNVLGLGQPGPSNLLTLMGDDGAKEQALPPVYDNADTDHRTM